MTTTPKTPTASGISRLLAKAGFEKSETRSTAIKGWHEWSAGYRASRGWNDGEVYVEHRVSSFHLRDASAREDEAKKLAAYTEAITGAGWKVRTGDCKLIVTAKEG